LFVHICSLFTCLLVYLVYLDRLCRSAWVGRSSASVCLSVCLFVRSVTQKRMIPKCSNSMQGMTVGYPRSEMVLGLQGHRLGLELGLGIAIRCGFVLYECLIDYKL